MQVSESGEGLVSWATHAMESTEMVLEGFSACALEHDEWIKNADMHTLHEAVIQAQRISAQSKAAEVSPTHKLKQLEHVKRLEGSITLLRQDLEISKASFESKAQLLLEAQQEAQELRQVNDVLA
jgi:hypothetical protein